MKRPLTAFFLFMYIYFISLSLLHVWIINVSLFFFYVDNVFYVCIRDDFRKTYKEENPDSKGGKEVQIFIFLLLDSTLDRLFLYCVVFHYRI